MLNSSWVGKLIWGFISIFPAHIKAWLLSSILHLTLYTDVKRQSLSIFSRNDSLIVARHSEHKEIKLSLSHLAYLRDVVRSFDYYFDSVVPQKNGLTFIVDFSQPRDHSVVGFDLFPIHLPSLAEPISTNLQYIDFGKLELGDVVIDLGAYAGLSSIMFKEAVGKSGIVVAVEPDAKNIVSLKKNFKRYESSTGSRIELVEAAIWNHSKGISFTSDGNMGSSATEILGDTRGVSSFIPTVTLTDLAASINLPKVSLVKCDIEGGELAVFKDMAFFRRFRPRIIIESHVVNGELTTSKVIEDLILCGYSVTEVNQAGVDYPLLECIPN